MPEPPAPPTSTSTCSISPPRGSVVSDVDTVSVTVMASPCDSGHEATAPTPPSGGVDAGVGSADRAHHVEGGRSGRRAALGAPAGHPQPEPEQQRDGPHHDGVD